MEMQNAECEMQNQPPLIAGGGAEGDGGVLAEFGMQNAECRMQSEEELTEAPSVTQSNKAHLSSSVPRAARVPTGVLTKGEMAEIREIFGDIDDAEIQRLYKRVTK